MTTTTYPDTKVNLSELGKAFRIPWGIESRNVFIVELAPHRRVMKYDHQDDGVFERAPWWPWTYISIQFDWRLDNTWLNLEDIKKNSYIKSFHFNGIWFAKKQVKKPSDKVYTNWLPNMDAGHPCFGDLTLWDTDLDWIPSLNIKFVDFFDNIWNNDTHYWTLERPMVEHWIKKTKAKVIIEDRPYYGREIVNDVYPKVLKHWARLSLRSLFSESRKGWGPSETLNDAVNAIHDFNFKNAKPYLKEYNGK